ncbi:DUF4268 domain-containing protein [uncultured Zobellia sp.]|uniref:DUF4268 domain-containing protein n=1 Tax=uncultured Zobellia sp. TaxID=255433 RepID=UPI002592E4F5|nr:DUF4268 domain-containing protein [uncultured Zobellia sp.]
MKATELPIINFLQTPNVQFVIPVYQRNYDWEIGHCKQLLSDIINVEHENRGTHFIGSIVFIYEGAYSTSEVRELVIIDGQQRLTTINILYVSLYRFAKDKGMEKEAEMLYNMYLVNQYVELDSSKLKLKQTDTNSMAFNAILDGNEKGFTTYSNVIENYSYFSSQINDTNFETIKNGLKRLIFVEISLERDKDDPQRIFESLNSTGLDLSQSDLIRNYILMDLQPKEQQKVFNSIWNPIEENARDLVKQKSLVSAYIRDYLTLKNKKIPNKSKVYQEFKNNYTDKKSEDYMNELESIKALSLHYKMFVNPHTVNDSQIRQQLEYINRLEINVAYPFLLQVFDDWDNDIIDKNVLLQVLSLVQNYAWRRFIVGLPTNALNKIFMTLYSEIDTEEYFESFAIALLSKKGNSRFPNDDDVLSALEDKDLYNIKAKNRNYLFELLENFNNREYVDTSREDITVEHIFPQKPNEDWVSSLNEEEFLLFKEKHLNTIANLTLSGNNGSLGNKTFLDKKKMNSNGGEQGYIYSRLWLNDYLKTIDIWNISNYEARLKIISDRFLKIWQYPKVELPDNEVTTEQLIFEADSPRHKKLEYFIFKDDKVEESAIANMYGYVLKELYAINTELFLNNDILKVSRDSFVFRGPQEIVNGYYVEFNLDSESKFSILKRLLTLYDLEEELLIKYDTEAVPYGNRFYVRKEYWSQLLPLLENTELFLNVNPTKSHWISTGAGKTGVNYTMVVTGTHCQIEVGLVAAKKETNKKHFKKLKTNQEEIENAFSEKLIWQELPDKKMSRIKFMLNDVNLFDKSHWPKMNEFFVENLPLFERAFQPDIKIL